MSDRVHNGRVSKVDRYKWAKPDKPGVFMLVSKHELSVDHDYQRDVNGMKVRRIASEFSWPAFGVLIVAMRPDNSLYIIEGQHRHAAALNRTDIDEVPCMVFECADRKNESKIFRVVNTDRKPMSGVARHRANSFEGTPNAVLVERLVQAAGRALVDVANNSGRTVGCVRRMTMLAESQPDRLAKLFPLIDSVVGNNPLSERMLEGIMWVESKMPEGQSLLDKRWTERLHAVGLEELERAAKRSAAGFGKGGASTWGRGVLAAINKGLKNRLVLPGVEDV